MGLRWTALWTLFDLDPDPFDPEPAGSGPLDDRIQLNPSKGTISGKCEENNGKPAMRRPFLVTHPINPETGEKTLFLVPSKADGIRLV